MRCSEARERLIRSRGSISEDSSDLELRDHLRACRDCALFAQAERSLGSDLAAAAFDDNSDKIPLSELRSQVENEADRNTIRKKIMSKIENQFNTRPKLIAGISLAVLTFCFMTLIPFSATHTVGYNVSIAGVDRESEISPDLLEVAMTAIGYEDVSVEVKSTETTSDYVIVNVPTEVEARDVAEAMVTIMDVDGAVVDVEPVRVVLKEPLYAQVAGVTRRDSGKENIRMRFFDGKIFIEGDSIPGGINSGEMSDSDVKASVEKLIDRIGMEGTEFKIDSETDTVEGTRTITLYPAGDMSVEAGEDVIQIWVDEGVIGTSYAFDKGKEEPVYMLQIKMPDDKTLKGNRVILKVKLKERAKVE
jgi:hypothetical protein